MPHTNPLTPPRRYLIVAEHRKGNGVGHMRRCARLALRLPGPVRWLLPLEESESHYGRRTMLTLIGSPELPVQWIDGGPALPSEMVIIDRREMNSDEFRSVIGDNPAVGIDLGGTARDLCSYLIDTLPKETRLSPPNLFDPALIPAPQRRRNEWPRTMRRILISLGGEHASNRAFDLATALDAACRRTGQELEFTVTAVVAPSAVDGGVHTLIAPGTLAEQLADFDLLVTHFGLTAYEALWARVPVLLVHPTPYHAELGERAGFDSLELNPAQAVAQILDFAADSTPLVNTCERLRPTHERSLSTVIEELVLPPTRGDASLQKACGTALLRERDRTFFEVENGLIVQERFDHSTMRYEHDYFFSDYQRQYGRTYLEDFSHIMEVGRRRCRDVLRTTRFTGGARLLDIGCAYGPFLSAAAAAGFEVVGIDVAREGVEYVRDQLGLRAEVMDLRDAAAEPLGGLFDVVTMWYVIEHFPDLERVFQAVRALLKPGGYLAIATPNIGGISGRRSRAAFLRRGPVDHFTVWNASSVKRTLQSYGFELRALRVTGHHPERFPGFSWVRPGGFPHIIGSALSQVFALGDTFEAIAQVQIGDDQP